MNSVVSTPTPGRMVDSGHFLSARDTAARLFEGRRQWLMEHFYRHQRQRHGVLLTASGQPLGGRWNYDAENRKAWPGTPALPADWRTGHDHSALWRRIEARDPAGAAQAARRHIDFVRQRWQRALED